MHQSKWFAGAAALVLAGSVFVLADEAKPDAKPAKPAHVAKLTNSWSELSSITDDQKKQILEVHAKANEEIKAIHAKEKSDILALLTPAQKKELAQVEERDADAKKGVKEAAPTTKPTAPAASAEKSPK